MLGLPLFFGAMFLMFQGIYALGVPLQAGVATVLDGFGAQLLRPLLGGLPPFLSGFLMDGLYQGIGTVAAFLPVIFLFFLTMGVVKDNGYLSRAAFLIVGLMERLGLDCVGDADLAELIHQKGARSSCWLLRMWLGSGV